MITEFFIWDKRTNRPANSTPYPTKSAAERAARNLVTLSQLANGAWEVLSTGQLVARLNEVEPRDSRDAEWGTS